MQFVHNAEEWLSTIASTQDDAGVNFGPVVASPTESLYALHINKAHFHATHDASISLDFLNTTWFCEGARGILQQATEAALLSPQYVASAGLGTHGGGGSQLRAPGDVSMPPPSPSSDATNTPSTVLLAAVASGAVGANPNQFQLLLSS
jgi:hypothetical protein